MADTKITVALALESANFAKQITAINKELKLNEAQFKQAASGVRDFESTAEGAQSKVNYLTTALEQQGKKTQTYKNEVAKSKSELEKLSKEHEISSKKVQGMSDKLARLEQKYGKNSEEANKYREKVAAAKDEHAKIESKIVSTSSRLTTLETDLARSETAWNNYNTQLQEAQRELSSFNVDRARQGLMDFGASMQSAGDRMYESGSRIAAIGSTLDDKIGQPLRNVGKSSLKVGMDFEAAMSNVRALSGATGEDFTKLKEKAKEMGAGTTKTAKESADALGYMALAGWDTNQMLTGLEPILKLSEAGAMDLAKASDLVTDSMGGLSLTADDLGGYLDKVAKTSTLTNTSAQNLLEAFLNVGATATSLNIPLDDLSASLGILANNGLKGKSAGTKLNAMLTRMTAQSGPAAEAWEKLGVKVFDGTGKFRGLETVLNETRIKLSKYNDETQQTILKAIMGTYNITPFRNLIASTGDEAKASGKSFRDFANNIGNSEGALNKMRETMQDNTQGSLASFRSALEGVGIEIAEQLLPALTPLLNGLTEVLKVFNKLPEPVKKGIVQFGLMAALAPKLTKGFGQMRMDLGGLTRAFGSLATQMASGQGILGKLGNVLLRNRGAATALAGGLNVATGATSTLVAGAAAGGQAAGALGGGLAAAGTAAGGAGAALGAAGGAMSVLGGALLTALPWLAGGAALIGGLVVTGKAFAGEFNDDVVPAVDLFADKVEMASVKVKDANGFVQESTEKVVTKISEGTKQAVGAYMELDRGASEHMMQFAMNQNVLTSEMKTNTINKFKELTAGVKFESNDMKEAYILGFTELMNSSTTLSQATKDQVVSKVQEMVDMNKNLSDGQKTKIVEDFMTTFAQSNALTEEGANGIVQKFDALRVNVNTSLTNQYNEQKEMLTKHFAESNALTEEQEKAMLQSLTDNYNQQTIVATEHENRIKEIVNTAKNEKRQLKDEELREINEIQDKMRTHAVNALSEQESESEIILGRMKGNQNRITVEMVSENIKKLNEQRDKAVQAAQDECTRKIQEYNKLKQTLPPEQAGMVDELIREAERNRDQQIVTAEELRGKMVGEMEKMGGEMLTQVNTDTGNIKIELNGFQKWWNEHLSFLPKKLKFKEEREIVTKTITSSEPQGKSIPTPYSMLNDNVAEAYSMQQSRVSDNLNKLRASTYIPGTKSLSGMINSATSISNNNASKVTGSNNELLNAINGQNELLMKVIGLLADNKDVNVSLDIDGRSFAKATAKYVGSELDTLNRRKARLGGNI